MPRYLAGRVGQALGVTFAISLIAFLLVRLVPGDPVRAVLGVHATPTAVDQLRHSLGLDRPAIAQYVTYVGGLVQGHLGTSITQHTPVASLVGPRIVPTLLLIGYALVVALIIAVPLGIAAATRRNRPFDHMIRGLATLTLAMPTFWLGVMLALLVGVRLKLLPTSGYGTTFSQHVESLTLPAVTVGLLVAPLLLRTLRSAASDILDSEFIEACRARGISNSRVLYRHVLRNAALPLVTVFGAMIGFLLSWTVAAENVFAIPGLGSLLVTSVTTRDFPTVQALIFSFGIVIVLANLLTDLAYVVLDPRVRL
jgi:peptide/nickel transport system permease protein